ncbi:unnamed protein product [Thlaspi arvense]|uniref:RNase H type-1 domain-containing protein n=1 Tax=Thlaspi arvense TaxID=13288 RepID=A0AAU9SSZ7_THLAR|nr:unnamed protein product [Thlaspi arvense]
MAFIDKQQWEEAINADLQSSGIIVPSLPVDSPAINDILDESSEYYSLVDASWVSASQRAGIRWSLFSKEGIQLLKGSASIPPTQTVLEAEAQALLMATQHLHVFGYPHVTFVVTAKCYMSSCNLIREVRNRMPLQCLYYMAPLACNLVY